MTLYNSCYRPFPNKNLSLVLMITFTTESKRSDLKSFGKYQGSTNPIFGSDIDPILAQKSKSAVGDNGPIHGAVYLLSIWLVLGDLMEKAYSKLSVLAYLKIFHNHYTNTLCIYKGFRFNYKLWTSSDLESLLLSLCLVRETLYEVEGQRLLILCNTRWEA